MRAVAMLAILVAAGLAGCMTSQPPPAGTPTNGPPAAPDPAAYKVPPVPKVDAAALLDDHATFVTENANRQGNTPQHESARQSLLQHFQSYGLQTYRFNFTNGIKQADLLGIRWGVDRTHWVFVGGHYDIVDRPQCPDPVPDCPTQVNTQGAYDDGSGTMLTVHLAKAFANVTPFYTIAFVAYDGEERGIQGAAAIVHAIQEGSFTVDGITPTIVGDLDLDMVGINWPGTMAPINMMDNTKAGAALVLAKAKQMGFPGGQLVEKDHLKLGASDYAAFWGVREPAAIPTLFFISDFEEMGAPAPAPDAAHTPTAPDPSPAPLGVYPFWHLEDTVQTMTAMAGGHDALVKGFQAAADLGAYVIHFLACDPAHRPTDAVVRT
jgi:hypothetical protein